MSRRLQEAHASYILARAEYRRRYDDWTQEMRRQWDEKLEAQRADYKAALVRWRGMMSAMNRLSQPSAQSLLTLTAVLDAFKHRLF